jgi:hypothetical protein
MRIRSGQLFAGIALLALGMFPASAQTRPEHVILWVVDGISDKAPDRVDLPNLKALAAQGVYYRQNYTVQTADPSHVPGQWSTYHTSSIPNPVLLAGTAMLRPGDQHYVQESFFPLKITAHIVNEISYRALNVGFHYTAQAGGSLMRGAGYQTGDDKTLSWATYILHTAKPTFMLIHMQDTGFAGGSSRTAPAGSPYKDNIWGEGSPYRKTVAQQDVYLGKFIEELKKEGIWDKTVIFLTGDHGQTETGGHPLDASEAWAMPLVIAGPGIKKDQKFEYAESIDVVPTLCYLMGVTPPINADGRILAEALVSPPANVAPRQQKIKELDFALLDVEKAIEKLKAAHPAGAGGRGRSGSDPVADAERDYYKIERILEWNKFGTYDRLIDHHKRLVARINASLK